MNEQLSDIRSMKPVDFANFGLNVIAYVRPVTGEDDEIKYEIHAANGATLAEAPSIEVAQALIHQNEMESVLAH